MGSYVPPTFDDSVMYDTAPLLDKDQKVSEDDSNTGDVSRTNVDGSSSPPQGQESRSDQQQYNSGQKLPKFGGDDRDPKHGEFQQQTQSSFPHTAPGTHWSEEFEASKGLLKIWMSCSGFLFGFSIFLTISFFIFFQVGAMLAGILGMFAVTQALYRPLFEGSQAANVHIIAFCARLAFITDIFHCIGAVVTLAFFYEIEEIEEDSYYYDGGDSIIDFMMVVNYVGLVITFVHLGISLNVSLRFKRIQAMLNPVSSGLRPTV